MKEELLRLLREDEEVRSAIESLRANDVIAIVRQALERRGSLDGALQSAHTRLEHDGRLRQILAQWSSV